MRFPNELYQMTMAINEFFPNLRPAPQRGLALWVYGTILAHSACQNAVITALLFLGAWDALREWLYDGQDKAAPCQTQVDISCCFGPLIRWVLSWWQDQRIALAVDATAHGDLVVSFTVSVLYRGCAIPVAWHILPANRKGAWMGHILDLLELIAKVLPSKMKVLVLVDRGLWSQRLRKGIRRWGYHPIQRLQNTIDGALLMFEALGKSGPDRAKIRDHLENRKGFVGADGIFNFSPTDHNGLDESSLAVIQIIDGKWKLVKQPAPIA